MRAHKVDANQKEIVETLRRLGCSVAITSASGEGFPDIVVGYKGINYLVEIKDGSRIPSQRRLTPDQVTFHDNWKGQIKVVESVNDAINLLRGV